MTTLEFFVAATTALVSGAFLGLIFALIIVLWPSSR